MPPLWTCVTMVYRLVDVRLALVMRVWDDIVGTRCPWARRPAGCLPLLSFMVPSASVSLQAGLGGNELSGPNDMRVRELSGFDLIS